MNPFRRRRTRTRLSLLAIVMLLWSQLAMAAHPGCLFDDGAATARSHAAAVDEGGCEHEMPPHHDPVCRSYCGQGEVSGDVARVPPVPPLPSLAAPAIAALIVPTGPAAPRSRATADPPRVAPHRPTSHPAALLLI